VLLDPTQVLIADEEQMQVTTSNSASVQMEAEPTNDSVVPVATDLVSLFQVNCTAVAAVRWASWARANDSAVAVLTGVSY
jgi:hypothetical protein